MNARVPADVDMPDRIVAGLTARQIAILGAHGLVIWAMYAAFSRVFPLALIGAIAMPVVALGAAWTWGKPHGTTFERLAVGAVRFVRTPRRKVTAPEGLASVPFWAGHARDLATIDAPAGDVAADGTIELPGAGSALLCRASSVNLSLRSEREQVALVEGFGRMLNAMDAPAQFVIRSERADLRELVDTLEQRAPSLAHPALERAAREHAAFLRSLGARRDVLHRRVLLCVRDTTSSDGSAARLRHHAEEAATLLRGIGIKLEPLENGAARELLARAVDPEGPPPPREATHDGEVVEGTR